MENEIKRRIEESIQVKTDMAKDVTQIKEVIDLVVKAYKDGCKVVLFGNGGSASQCSHIAAEFTIRYEMDRPSLEAVALNTDISALTAAGNDFGYDSIFERQVDSIVKKGDVVIGLSTSGNSPNVLKGMKKSKKLGAVTVALVGSKGLYNNLEVSDDERLALEKETADIIMNVPSKRTSVIQEAHITIGHIICGFVEQEVFKE